MSGRLRRSATRRLGDGAGRGWFCRTSNRGIAPVDKLIPALDQYRGQCGEKSNPRGVEIVRHLSYICWLVSSPGNLVSGVSRWFPAMVARQGRLPCATHGETATRAVRKSGQQRTPVSENHWTACQGVKKKIYWGKNKNGCRLLLAVSRLGTFQAGSERQRSVLHRQTDS